MSIRIHPTAEVSPNASIGSGTSIWHHAQVREGAVIGSNCIVGKGVYIDSGVSIGDNVKIQNYASLYKGVSLEDGVFVGPHVCFTNDLRPRAINPDATLKAPEDWQVSSTRILKGAALGANSTLICGVTIGAWAMIGAGSVVTHDVPDHGLMWGNPARLRGFVCTCGADLTKQFEDGDLVIATCTVCGSTINITRHLWEDLL
jgi:acetyltransferase-like isoleucine patch superfamily enzyme